MKKCTTLGLGCFWKPEENFKDKPGIIQTEVGYAEGSILMLLTKKYVAEILAMQRL